MAITTLLSLTVWTKPAEAAPGICTVYGYINYNVPSELVSTVIIGAPTLGLPINNAVFVQDATASGAAITPAVSQFANATANTQVSNPRPYGTTARGWSGFSVEC